MRRHRQLHAFPSVWNPSPALRNNQLKAVCHTKLRAEIRRVEDFVVNSRLPPQEFERNHIPRGFHADQSARGGSRRRPEGEFELVRMPVAVSCPARAVLSYVEHRHPHRARLDRCHESSQLERRGKTYLHRRLKPQNLGAGTCNSPSATNWLSTCEPGHKPSIATI